MFLAPNSGSICDFLLSGEYSTDVVGPPSPGRGHMQFSAEGKLEVSPVVGCNAPDFVRMFVCSTGVGTILILRGQTEVLQQRGSLRDTCEWQKLFITRFSLLCCALSCGAVYCNRPCLFVCVCVCVCLWVCSTITRNCVYRSSPNWVCR